MIFTDDDRDDLINELHSEEKNTNFTTMIYMLMYTGLRPSDILSITVDRIDLKKKTIKLYASKINKWFEQPIHDILLPVLKERIMEVKTGKLLNYAEEKNMGLAFRRYLKKIGLNGKGYNLRTFRKDYISRGQQAGIPIQVISRLVGHSNIKTTMEYYTYFSTDYLHEELKKMNKVESKKTADKNQKRRRSAKTKRLIKGNSHSENNGKNN